MFIVVPHWPYNTFNLYINDVASYFEFLDIGINLGDVIVHM